MMRTNILVKTIIITSISCSTVYAKKNDYSTVNPYRAQNGSVYGDISKRTHEPKKDYVSGYNHSDGSRVRSHYRSRKNK